MQTVRSALIGVVLALLAFGLLGGTLLRQAIQVVPILMALRLTSRFPGYLGAYAAVSVSAFWMIVMVCVGLSAIGVSSLVPGPFAPIEILLSVLTALFAWVGFSRGRRLGRPLERNRKMATLAVFGVLQIVAVTLSVVGPELAESLSASEQIALHHLVDDRSDGMSAVTTTSDDPLDHVSVGELDLGARPVDQHTRDEVTRHLIDLLLE